jgi:8-oxo-dGTP pyrophosphatase MutT (NUDIX family)
LKQSAVEMSRFAPETFFARAAERLKRVPSFDKAGGDHQLNPDFATAVKGYLDAAVLIPVVARRPHAGVLLTRRTKNLAAHAGQIAFPGGKIEPADAGPAAAALREAQEEIGLDPAGVKIVGYLDPYLTRTGFRVMPVVGRIAPGGAFTLNPDEVDDLFEVPLSVLMTPANYHRRSRVLNGQTRYFYEIPFDGRIIWGATAGIIRNWYERMFG